MKVLMIVIMLGLAACGSKESLSGPSRTLTDQNKKECVITENDAQKLVGTYASIQEATMAVADWTLHLAHNQNCAVNDENKFEATLDQFLAASCHQNLCEIKVKPRGNQ
jgi:hypothetical protein